MATSTRKTWPIAALIAAAVAAPGAYASSGPPGSVAQIREQTERAFGSTVNPALAKATVRQIHLSLQVARAQTERALGSTVNPAALTAKPRRSSPSVAELRRQTERALGSTVGVGLTPLAIAPAPVSGQSGGFHWGDASVGGGFVAALGLFAAAALVLLRRRGAPA